MIRVFTMALLVAFAAPSAAWANDENGDGWYLAAQAGINWMQDEEWSDSDGDEIEPDWNKGAGGALTVGRTFGSSWRGELELGYRNNSVDSTFFTDAGIVPPPIVAALPQAIAGGTTGLLTADGDVTLWTAMVNVLYDLDDDGFLRPFAGVGVGLGGMDLNVTTAVTSVDDNDTTFAYQGILGVLAHFTDTVNLEIRYVLTGLVEPEFTTAAGDTFDTDAFSQSVNLVVRWNL